MKNINFIDLFAGASGLAEGFIKAGFNPVAHIEMDKDACDTIKTRAAYHYLLKENKEQEYIKYLKGKISRDDLYRKIPENIINSVYNEEITDDSIDSLFRKIDTKIGGEKIDFIIGGPPCQAYSLLGRHQNDIENDPRNKLYIQYGRFLNHYKPKGFVFENVTGLLSSNKGKHFINIKKYFRRIGYEVYPKILNAYDYGVLQKRKRVIIVGWKKEIDFRFPKIEKAKIKETVFDLFADLPKLLPGEELEVAKYTAPKSEYLEHFGMRNGVDFVTQNLTRSHNIRDLEIYEIAIKKWNNNRERLKYPELPERLKTHKNEKSFIDRFKVVDGNGASHTVVAHIAKDGHYYIHPDLEQCRSLSVREAARLQGFPDDFYFEGSRSAAFRQIGNAVPPIMAYAIAKSIRELL